MTSNTVAVARRALESLGARPADHRVLNVQCRRSHHVAAVYATAAGAVYQADTGPHAHGRRDFVDSPHGATTKGTEFVDLLTAGLHVADEVPAWCDCGHWTLSRNELSEQARPGGRTIHLP